MSDETSPPFSGFRNARPARKTPTVPQPDDDPEGRTFLPGGSSDMTVPKRKRRTRAEIEASTHSPLTPTGELAVLKACLKQLRSLDDQARARTLVLLKAVFE